MDKTKLAQAIRKLSGGQEQQPINISIKLDMSSLAKAMQSQTDKPEYQKVDGLSPNVS